MYYCHLSGISQILQSTGIVGISGQQKKSIWGGNRVGQVFEWDTVIGHEVSMSLKIRFWVSEVVSCGLLWYHWCSWKAHLCVGRFSLRVTDKCWAVYKLLVVLHCSSTQWKFLCVSIFVYCAAYPLECSVLSQSSLIPCSLCHRQNDGACSVVFGMHAWIYVWHTCSHNPSFQIPG